MYVSIKVTKETFNEVDQLCKELKENHKFPGRVTKSAAIQYAVEQTLEEMERRKHLKNAAGGWADMDTDALIKEIYEDRLRPNNRPEVNFD